MVSVATLLLVLLGYYLWQRSRYDREDAGEAHGRALADAAGHADRTAAAWKDPEPDLGQGETYRLLGDEEVACFPAGSWDGVYKHDGNRVREKDGRERTAQRLEVQLSVAD